MDLPQDPKRTTESLDRSIGDNHRGGKPAPVYPTTNPIHKQTWHSTQQPTISSAPSSTIWNAARRRTNSSNPKKNIDECCDYILDSVYKSGRNGFADDEIYALALHYYDEDDIEVGKHRECRVIVNHTIELTEEEKAEARREAMRRATQEAYAQLTKHPQAKKAASDKSNTPTLF